MALSPKMLAVLQKVDTARAEYFAKMRAKNVEDRARWAKPKVAPSFSRRAAQARAAKPKPPPKTSLLTKQPTALKAIRARSAKAKKRNQ